MPKRIKLKHVPSREFRTALVDNALVSLLQDKFGERLTLTLVRVEALSTSEDAQLEDNGAVTLLAGVQPDHEIVKRLEFAAEMRPDHAMAVVNAILGALSNLPLEKRKFYGIPDQPPPPTGTDSGVKP